MLTAAKRHRVIVLCNPTLHTKASALVLMRAGVNVIGIVAARGSAGVDRARRSIKRNGFAAFLSRGLSRTLCRLWNGRRDKKAYESLYDGNEIDSLLSAARVPVEVCHRYDEPDVLAWIRRLAPDILVVHSATIVPKPVRELARAGLVIGGHPGLTQFFRGGNSSFWAIYQNRPEDLGWTVFYVDKGVDTGDLISQGKLELQPGDSFETLDWRAMLCIAEEQARWINRLDSGGELPRRPYGTVDAGTLYWYPRLLELIRYRFRQRIVR